MALSRIDTTNMIEDVPQSKLDNNINFRNIIINGDMSIAQRGTSTASLSSGANFGATDRFKLYGVTFGTWTMSQSTDVPTGQGFAKSLKMDCTTANGSLSADSQAQISQGIEGQNLQYLKKGTSSAESLTWSFWTKSNKTGTYICQIRDIDNSRSISKSYTISSANTWEKKIITFPGDTTGALDNDNGKSFEIRWWLVAGTNFTSGSLATSWGSETNANNAVGQVNLADSTSNEWYITGVQLEAGTTASDFEFLPHDVNLARCERYFETIADGAQPTYGTVAKICNASVYSTTGAYSAFQYRTIKRTAPSLYVTTGSQFYRLRSGGSNFPCTDSTLDFGTATNRSGRMKIAISGATVGRGGWITINSQATGFVALDAEL